MDRNKIRLTGEQNYLHLLVSAGLVINYLLKVLPILSKKRATLAQKAIQAELRICANWERLIVASLLRHRDDQSLFEPADCMKLNQINIKLTQELKAFYKAASYDLNYVEQYYEHDFWLRLSNDQLSRQLESVLSKLSR